MCVCAHIWASFVLFLSGFRCVRTCVCACRRHEAEEERQVQAWWRAQHEAAEEACESCSQRCQSVHKRALCLFKKTQISRLCAQAHVQQFCSNLHESDVLHKQSCNLVFNYQCMLWTFAMTCVRTDLIPTLWRRYVRHHIDSSQYSTCFQNQESLSRKGSSGMSGESPNACHTYYLLTI